MPLIAAPPGRLVPAAAREDIAKGALFAPISAAGMQQILRPARKDR
jgi:hypothetical protein